jgi:L-aminopeptidase/D-esterase-like protein
MKGLTDIPGVRVGHASDFEGLTGCTVILCEGGAVGGADIRGSATGTSEFELLTPLNVTDRVHAVVFAGGSAFGLEAASGVRRYLEKQGIGFPTAAGKVPLVPAAILYDLAIGKASARPDLKMGEQAAAAASANAVEEGCVGAGVGATVGKLAGMKTAMKGGVGSYTVALDGANAAVRVSALAAVNAVGDIRDAQGRIVAGTRKSEASAEFADSNALMKRATRGGFSRENTTLVCVATNALLTKAEARKLAQLGQLGVARAISPVNTMSDGDVVVALSIGRERAPIDALGVAAAEAVAEAIVRGVRLARTLGGVPGLQR